MNESDFKHLFYSLTGMSPEYAAYKMEEIETRVSHIESTIKDYSPLIGASLLKLEAMRLLLQDKGHLSDKEVDSKLKAIAENADILDYLENKGNSDA